MVGYSKDVRASKPAAWSDHLQSRLRIKRIEVEWLLGNLSVRRTRSRTPGSRGELNSVQQGRATQVRLEEQIQQVRLAAAAFDA